MNAIIKAVVPSLVGLALFYIPFIWCRYKKIDSAAFGLSWTSKRKNLVECLLLTAAILGGLTLISLNWPWESLPRRMSLRSIFNLGTAGLAAAIIEEVFYRGWLQQLLKKKLPVALAVILTSAIFASSHVFVAQAPFMIAVFFPGCIMGFLRERHGNIATSTLFHGLSNLWAIWYSPFVWPTMDWVMQKLSSLLP